MSCHSGRVVIALSGTLSLIDDTMIKSRRLTDDYIHAMPPAPERDGKPSTKLYKDAGRGAVDNLWLRVTTGGAKTWALCARFPSKPRNPILRKIGRWPAVTLNEARDVARGWNVDIAKGIDPQEKKAAEDRERRAQQEKEAREEARKKAGTFENVAEAYIEKRVKQMRSGRNVAQTIRRYLVKRWGKLPVSEISKTDVIELLEDVEKRHGTYAAHKAYSFARALFTWLLLREDPRHPTLGLTANPCIGVQPDKFIGKREPRQRTFEPSEIRLMWEATAAGTYPVDPYVRLLLILGCQRDELSRAAWSEFDLDAATWKLLETRTKNAEVRVIPLPAMAADILRSLPRFTGSSYVFTTTGGRVPWRSYGPTKQRLEAKITALNGGASIGDWRFHDLRRSMRSNLSAIPTISPIVAELMIGHRQQGLARVYDQHKYETEQRAGFEAWCSRLRSIVEPRPGNVVELRA